MPTYKGIKDKALIMKMASFTVPDQSAFTGSNAIRGHILSMFSPKYDMIKEYQHLLCITTPNLEVTKTPKISKLLYSKNQ